MNKRHLLIVCAVFVMFCGCLDSGMATGPQYTATAWLIVKSHVPAVQESAEREFSAKEFEIYKKTQRLMLKSRFVLSCAVQKPGVAKYPSVKKQLREGDAICWLGEIIKADFPGDAEIMSVTCTRDDPEEAQVLLQAVVSAYLEEYVASEHDSRRRRISELEECCMSIEQKLRKNKEAFKQLTADSPKDEKTGEPKQLSVELQMLQLHTQIFMKEYTELQRELHKQEIELTAPPRVMQVGAIEKPRIPD